MLLKAREYFDNNRMDADVLEVTTNSATLAVPKDAVPSKRFAWIEFLLGQDNTVKALGRVEEVRDHERNVVVKFVFKHMFPADRRALAAFLGA